MFTALQTDVISEISEVIEEVMEEGKTEKDHFAALVEIDQLLENYHINIHKIPK